MGTFNPIFYYNIITAASINPYIANQIAYYPFDSNANDLINAQNGTSTNISYANLGKVGNSATFNGTNSLITVADTNNFSFLTSSFSINAWVYIDTGFTTAMIFNKRSTTQIEYDLQYTTSNTVIFRMFANGTTASFIGKTFNATLVIGTWNMITITFGGGTSVSGINGYLNGLPMTFSNLGTTYVGMINTNANLIFGRQGNNAGNFFKGRLDQTRFWNGRELTALEVLDIYNTLY